MVDARLDALEVLVLDCQASGATPAHGDLLEIGWAVTTGEQAVRAPVGHWVTPASDRPVSRIVRELTGWDEQALASSIAPGEAWSRLAAAATSPPMPTVIHWARFELPFLRLLHATHGAGAAFPFHVVCLHAVGARLFPELPRRSLRALAGHLGASPAMLRRAEGHVDVSAFVWRALVPRLGERGITEWTALVAWLAEPAPPSGGVRRARAYPMESAKRRALPDLPGVYRFLRPNGDVLYVGKAASLKKRVASHFKKTARTTERALEMLSQAHDVDVTVTPTALEAALLETDEIKRLDPPYNVHLRQGDRFAWFASADWAETGPAVSEVHRVGPLPSRTSVAGIRALRELLLGEEATDERRASAVRVPARFAPPLDLFDEAWRAFRDEELGGARSPQRRIMEASARIVVQESPDEDAAAPDGWDPAAVRRYLERVVVGEGTLVRRGRLLTLLAGARVTFREALDEESRQIVLDAQPHTCRQDRQARFDAATYDRLRVLATELRRVVQEGGDVTIRVSGHVLRLGR